MKQIKTLLVLVLGNFIGILSVFTFAYATTLTSSSSGNSGPVSDKAEGDILYANEFNRVLDMLNPFSVDGDGDVGIGTTVASGSLKLDVEGPIGATEYCDENGNDCKTISRTQQRVSSSCSAGSSIRQINSDGTVVCEADDMNSGGGIECQVRAENRCSGTSWCNSNNDPSATSNWSKANGSWSDWNNDYVLTGTKNERFDMRLSIRCRPS